MNATASATAARPHGRTSASCWALGGLAARRPVCTAKPGAWRVRGGQASELWHQQDGTLSTAVGLAPGAADGVRRHLVVLGIVDASPPDTARHTHPVRMPPHRVGVDWWGSGQRCIRRQRHLVVPSSGERPRLFPTARSLLCAPNCSSCVPCLSCSTPHTERRSILLGQASASTGGRRLARRPDYNCTGQNQPTPSRLAAASRPTLYRL